MKISKYFFTILTGIIFLLFSSLPIFSHKDAAVTSTSLVDISISRTGDNRNYHTFKLDNGLEVLVITDPSLQKSSAAMDVNVGSLEDPEEHLGLAHFLEHMLFLGTEKYPEIGDFEEFLTANQGYSNAYTDEEHTNFHFEASHAAFREALDRFAQFFIAPSFNQEYIDKEMHAVNSEHQNNVQDSYWRELRMSNLFHRIGHPTRKFATGNIHTLKNVTRDVLSDFFRKHYSAGVMKLTVLSRYDVATLEKWTREYFGPVPDNGRRKYFYSEKIFDEAELPRLIRIKPVTEKRSLKLCFEAPSAEGHHDAKPYFILEFLIGHEGEGSLLSLLKEKNLASGITCGVYFSSFAGIIETEIRLTDKGINDYEEVIGLFFSYINLLKKEGYKKHIYDENKTMEELNYYYREPTEGAEAAACYAELMHKHPPLEIDKKVRLITCYSQESFRTFLDKIKPSALQAFLIGPELRTDHREKYYGIEYGSTDFPDEISKSWESMSVHPAFRYPEVNQFVPDDLKLIKKQTQDAPVKVIDDKRGIFWLYNDRKCMKNIPKAVVSLNLLTEKVNQSPRNKALSILYASAINECLNEWKYPVVLAGLDFSIERNDRGIELKFEGYSDKLPYLMKETARKLKTVNVDEPVFRQIRKRLQDDLDNMEYEQPYDQAFYESRVLLYKGFIHRDRYTGMIGEIQLSDLKQYVETLFEEILIEGIAYGNVNPEFIAEITDEYYEKLGSAIPAEPILKQTSIGRIESGKSFSYNFTSKSNNHCWLKLVQFGKRKDELDAALRIGESFFDPRFYEKLRTDQQLGYVVWCGRDYYREALGLYFLVQSSDYDVLTLAGKGDKCIQDILSELSAMTDEEFTPFRNSISEALLQEEQTMAARFDNFKFEVLEMNGRFDHDQKIAEAVRALSRIELISIFQKALNPQSAAELNILHIGSVNELPEPSTNTVTSPHKFNLELPGWD